MSNSDPKIVQIARGLVRPITAYACLILLIITYAAGRTLDPEMIGIVGTVIGFYFGDRSARKTINGKEPDADKPA